jgi:hypothetical protein
MFLFGANCRLPQAVACLAVSTIRESVRVMLSLGPGVSPSQPPAALRAALSASPQPSQGQLQRLRHHLRPAAGAELAAQDFAAAAGSFIVELKFTVDLKLLGDLPISEALHQ